MSKDKAVADMPPIRVVKKKRPGQYGQIGFGGVVVPDHNPFARDSDKGGPSRLNYEQM